MRVGVFGASGRVGRLLVELLSQHESCSLSAAFLRDSTSLNLPKDCLITNDVVSFIAASDIIIDFSLPHATQLLLAALQDAPKPLVCGTTGLGQRDFVLLESLSQRAPVLYATNMSKGIAILNAAIGMVAKNFADADIEICEIHHRYKKDAPSGTALTLAETCARARGLELDRVRVSGRDGDIGARGREEISVMSLRGGDVAGRHVVGFYADGEYLEFLHNATSRLTFAKGAIDAALWLFSKPSGMYHIQDILCLDA